MIVTGYDVIEHASNPAHHGPAGGLHNYGRLLDLLGVFMGPVAAILIGAEAGAGDLAAGVFRDNVLTGRSRMALFLARIPAALAVDPDGHRRSGSCSASPRRSCSPAAWRRRTCR